MSLLHSKKRTPMLLFCIIFVLCIFTSEGTGGCVARYHSGTGTNIIVLEYTVKDGDSSPRLDYRISPKSLVAQNTEGGRLPVLGYVRRKSTAPITDANLDLLHLTGMADRHIIVIDGERPRMMDVSFDEEVKGQVLGKGDILKILIRFSSPVVIDQSLPPTLSLFVGNKK